MQNHRISSKTGAIVVAALSVIAGCADLPADDATTSDDGVAAQQFAPPSNAGELSATNIKIDAITATGAGCPAGSWTVDKVPEGSAFTLTFEKYAIEAAPTATPSKAQSSCDLSLKIRTPKDLSYAVSTFQFFGYANLKSGMKASLDAEYLFTGSGVSEKPASFHYDFPVPYDTTYAVNDDVEARGVAPSWSPCAVSTTLTVRTRLTLENPTDQPGILAMDNIDVRAQGAMKVNIQTRTCSPL